MCCFMLKLWPARYTPSFHRKATRWNSSGPACYGKPDSRRPGVATVVVPVGTGVQPRHTSVVYWDSENKALPIFPVHLCPPATHYRHAPGHYELGLTQLARTHMQSVDILSVMSNRIELLHLSHKCVLQMQRKQLINSPFIVWTSLSW